jgi:hypothetical protein
LRAGMSDWREVCDERRRRSDDALKLDESGGSRQLL